MPKLIVATNHPEYVSSYLTWVKEWEETNREYFDHVGLVIQLAKLREPGGEYVLLGWPMEQIHAEIARIEAELASRPSPKYVAVPWPHLPPFPEL